MRHKIFQIILLVLFITAACVALNSLSLAARLSGDEEVTPAASEAANTAAGGSNSPNSIADNNSSEEIEALSEETVNNDGDSSPEDAEEESIIIHFEDVDISQFIKYISTRTNKNFILDTAIKGKVNIICPKQITVDEAYKLFESVLEVHGFTTVPSGSAIKIVPAIDARSKNIETLLKEEAITPEDKVVTKLIPLKYADPTDVQKALSSLISKTSLIVPYEPTGTLIVTDVLSNVKRLLDIIKAIDVLGTGSEISVIPLVHATADTMATLLNTVFKATTKDAKTAQDTGYITIVDDERTNSLVVRASEVDIIKVKELIDLLDKETPRGEGGIYVYTLQNANAEELAKVLTEIPTGETSTTAPTKDAAKETAVVISKDVAIIADNATNSLIINASKDDYYILEDVIQKLDIPRRMVYIEALIMEVALSKSFDLGAQWYAGESGASHDGRDIVAFGSSTTGTDNLPTIDTTTGRPVFASGLSFGFLGDSITIGGLEFSSLGAVIRALRTDSDVQIISAPALTVLNNEEAEIISAQNRPFLTRKDESVSGTDYSNYEWKEVGVTLRITPQINQENLVRMNIYQEVSSVVEVTEEAVGLSTTQSRKAETTVEIKDGATLVIGGLIEKTENKSTYKVPLLGDIPFLGMLFRSKSESDIKTNLYIFITPHIIDNPAEAKELSDDKKGYIDTVREGAIRLYEGRSVTADTRLYNLGYGYLETGDYDKALNYFEKALEINPDNPYALLNTGFIYQKLGEKDKATAMYERLIKLDPDERSTATSDNMQLGRKLSDIAKDNLKKLQEENETNR